MSHLHVPDGVLPLWLVLAGWAVTALLVGVSARLAAGAELRRRVPLLGAVAALMLVAMSSEIVPIAYHINLAVVAGILLGWQLAPICALVVVAVLAGIGHGGVTVIGLNTLVIATEMMVGWALFRAFVRLLGPKRAGASAAFATVLTLAVTTSMIVGIVAIGGSGATVRESGALDPSTWSFNDPFRQGLLSSGLTGREQDTAAAPVDIRRFATMVYALGSVGWVLEALIGAAIVGFVARVRPALVLRGAQGSEARPTVGDEGAHH